jgi:hypothetical protein
MRRIFERLGDKVRIGSNQIELTTDLRLHMAGSVAAMIARFSPWLESGLAESELLFGSGSVWEVI